MSSSTYFFYCVPCQAWEIIERQNGWVGPTACPACTTERAWVKNPVSVAHAQEFMQNNWGLSAEETAVAIDRAPAQLLANILASAQRGRVHTPNAMFD